MKEHNLIITFFSIVCTAFSISDSEPIPVESSIGFLLMQYILIRGCLLSPWMLLYEKTPTSSKDQPPYLKKVRKKNQLPIHHNNLLIQNVDHFLNNIFNHLFERSKMLLDYHCIWYFDHILFRYERLWVQDWNFTASAPQSTADFIITCQIHITIVICPYFCNNIGFTIIKYFFRIS